MGYLTPSAIYRFFNSRDLSFPFVLSVDFGLVCLTASWAEGGGETTREFSSVLFSRFYYYP